MAVDFPDWTNPIIPGLFTLGGSGVTLVAINSTAIALRASTLVKVTMVKARAANAGLVYVGAAGVTDDETPTTGGFQLAAGDIIVFTETNLANVFLNGAAGDGVSYVWWA